MSKNHKKVCMTLTNIEQLLFLVPVGNRCALISTYASLVVIPIGIASSAGG